MTRRTLLALLVASLIGVALFYAVTIPTRISAAALPPRTPDLANGRQMFLAGGCASCHATPEQNDALRLGGGLALKTPFGTFYVPNISPDKNDGIGSWSEANFVTALWHGTSPDDRHLYPAFPYTSYSSMQLDDVRDLFAFLQNLEPVPGRAGAHDLKFPFGFRRGIGAWKILFFESRRFAPVTARSALWNRGAYLVNGPGHCAECHSPRNALGAIIINRRFSGGVTPDGEGKVPDITQAALGKWSEEDFAELLESGDTPDGQTVGSEMRTVVRSTAQLPAADRAAMAAYLKTLGASPAH
jgi:mono/diheme cytochrome c family protein